MEVPITFFLNLLMTCLGVPSIPTIFIFLLSFVVAIVPIDGTPKQVVITDTQGCNPQKLKKIVIFIMFIYKN
jgi:hypothetical protein